MTRVWGWNRSVTVREVLEDLRRDRSIAYTTVMTVLDNLRQKGWVRREQAGRAYRYTAVSTRAAYSAALMNDAWAESDNPAAALVAFFGMMSPEQTEALRDALRVRDVPGVRLASSEGADEDPPEHAGEQGPEGPGEGSPEPTGEPSSEPTDEPTVGPSVGPSVEREDEGSHG